MRELAEKREPITIELWIWPTVFTKIVEESRTFDLRRDQDFRAGDCIHYRERDHDKVTGELEYTGRECDAYVRSVLHGTRTDLYVTPKGENPLSTGYVIVALKLRKGSVRNVVHSAREHAASRSSVEIIGRSIP